MALSELRTLEAQDLLRHCLAEQGKVHWGPHFLKALADEGLTFPDAWHVLRTGRIYERAELDIKTGEHKYKVEGYIPTGGWLAIIFCFKEVDRAFLITIFSIESRRKT